MKSDLFILRRSAAEMLALALVELFPEIQLKGGEETRSGFYYDFSSPFLLQRALFPLVEEKMRALKKEGRTIERIEMLPQIAHNYFLQNNQRHLAKKAGSASTPLLQLLRIGEFVDLSSGPLLPRSEERRVGK